MSFFTFLILSFSLLTAHDYHLGLTEIVHNKEAKTLEGSIRLFTEDLDKAIEQGLFTKLQLNSLDEHQESDTYINKYIEQNLSIEVNNKLKAYNYIGKEYEEDAIWIYVEVENIKKIKQLSIKNTLIQDLYDDQKNILNVIIEGKTRGKTLVKDAPSYELDLK